MNDQNYAVKVNAAFVELKRRLRPAVIAETGQNAIYIRNYVKKHGLDLTNADDLQLAVTALDDKELIEWDTPPAPAPAAPVKTAKQITEEFQAKEQARILRAQIENSKPFDLSQKIAAQQNVEAEAKREADAEEALNSEIQSYECYRGPNSRDWSAINMVTAALKKISVKTNGKRNAVLTLALVRQVKAELPDQPKLGDVEKIVERIRAQQQQEQQKSPQQKQREEEEKRWTQRPR